MLVGFGTAAYYSIRQGRYQEVDAQAGAVGAVDRGGGCACPGAAVWAGGAVREGPDGQGFGPGRVRSGVWSAGVWWRAGRREWRGGRRAARAGIRIGGKGDGGGAGAGGRGDGFGPPGGPDGGPDGRGGPDRPNDLLAVELPPDMEPRFGDGENGSIYYYIWDYDRQAVKTSRAAEDVPDPGPPRTGPPQFGPPTPELPRFRQRGDLREAYLNGPAGTRILVGKSILTDQAELRRTAWMLIGAGTGVLVVGLMGGWLLSYRAVRPIQTITAAAQEISASNLSRRIDVAGTTSELGNLAGVLNDAFARLEAAFDQQVRFTADASHELRTPLSVIHTNTQLAALSARSIGGGI